jgi:glycosyltransferase involved in cell wall biosynthesis
MKIALIAPPFITVPPKDYGGTELFVAQLAEGLQKTGIQVVVYTIGESTVEVDRRWIYEKQEWPIKAVQHAFIKDMDHSAWAVRDAAESCDVIHLQSPQGIPCTRFTKVPVVFTLHGPHDPKLSELYSRYPDLYYVGISEFQRSQESLPRIRTIHHGIDLSLYQLREHKQQYLSFIGRIAPIKGTHLAIDVAKRVGIPLKIAGDIQPIYRNYFEAKIRPELDGKFIEYVGLADLKSKNELLGNSLAMLFPIKWNEPFGLVMVEAMACGTPVLAFSGGSVAEVVRDGVSGYVCRSVVDMAKRVTTIDLKPRAVRQYVEENFSLERMVGQYAALYREIIKQEEARKIA